MPTTETARYDIIEGRTYRKIVRLGGPDTASRGDAYVFIHNTTGAWYNAASWFQPNKRRPYRPAAGTVQMWNARFEASGVTARV